MNKFLVLQKNGKEDIYIKEDPYKNIDNVFYNLLPYFQKNKFRFFLTLTNPNWTNIKELKKDSRKLFKDIAKNDIY